MYNVNFLRSGAATCSCPRVPSTWDSIPSIFYVVANGGMGDVYRFTF